MVREAGVEPAASRLSIECSNHAELFPDGAPCQTRTGFSGLQVRRIADYAYRARVSGANGANRTLIGCLPCNCSPVELLARDTCKAPTCQRTRSSLEKACCHWSQRGYSKPRPPRYECGAPPLELLRHGAGAENRTPLTGLAVRCLTNRPHPQKLWSGRR